MKNGIINLATLSVNSEYLLELEVKNCDCPGTLTNIEKFKNLEEFIDYCNFIYRYINCSNTDFDVCKRKFKESVIRKNPLSLEEMAKCCVKNHFGNSIDELELPNLIKNDLKNDQKSHFEVSIDEKFTFVQYASARGYDYYIFNSDKENVLLSMINIVNYGWEFWKTQKRRLENPLLMSILST